MPVNTGIGVLTDIGIQYVEELSKKRVMRTLPLLPFEHTASRLFEQVWEVGLSEIWIQPGSRWASLADSAWTAQAKEHWEFFVRPDQRESARPYAIMVWPKQRTVAHGRRMTFMLAEPAVWNWQLSDATSLLATVTYVRQALGRPILDPPDLLAHQLLRDLTHDTPLAQGHASKAALPPLFARTEGAEKPNSEPAVPPLGVALGLPSNDDLYWMRPLTFREERQKYLHKYTHFSRELLACMQVPLGIGEGQYCATGRTYDGIRAGIWRVYAERAGSLFDGTRLPAAFGDEWMSTPQVKCCQDIGYRIEVREGYWWQESAPLFRAWGKHLWQAGERLQTQPQMYHHVQARGNALQTIQWLAARSIELLGEERVRGGWGRPDWSAQVTGRARAQLFASLVHLVRSDAFPILVTRQALWVVSNNPNPQASVPMLFSRQRWRGYSVAYKVPLALSSEVRTLLRTPEQAALVASSLDALAAETAPI